MPSWDDEYEVPEAWSQAEESMFDNLIGGDPSVGGDETLQLLFDVALFQDGYTPYEREAVQRALEEYLDDNYDIVFDEAFDWDAYRDWYEGG